MAAGDKIGVVSYSSSATTDYALQEIQAGGSTPEDAKAAVDGLYAGGMTSIGAGVQAADNQLDRFPGDPNRAMLVMSDGIQNEPPEPIVSINAQVDPESCVLRLKSNGMKPSAASSPGPM